MVRPDLRLSSGLRSANAVNVTLGAGTSKLITASRPDINAAAHDAVCNKNLNSAVVESFARFARALLQTVRVHKRQP